MNFLKKTVKLLAMGVVFLIYQADCGKLVIKLGIYLPKKRTFFS